MNVDIAQFRADLHHVKQHVLRYHKAQGRENDFDTLTLQRIDRQKIVYLIHKFDVYVYEYTSPLPNKE